MPFDKPGQTLGGALLPYEKELIRILGCTEEEYRRYATEVQLKSKARPAAYEHIPDIRCDPVSILVSVAIGAALSAVSALLAPKPQQPKEKKKGKNIRLASRQGSERFGPTSGFDTVADLANYAEPIAVIFARREDDIGGVLASPQLVWSRCFSYGNEQGVKLMFVVGEQGLGKGIQRPDLAGIYLGTSPLDAQYLNKFAFYWNRNTSVNGRILASNWAYGTRATADAGDPQQNEDIFLAPRGNAVNAKAFSQSYTPSSNTSFGCYGAIANGTGYRVNWELVPLPLQEDEDDDDAEDRLRGTVRRRWKIAGDWGQGGNLRDIVRFGQRGLGREYGRRMGIRFLNGVSQCSGGPDDHKALAEVKVGDHINFIIGGNVIEEGRYWAGDDSKSANVDDINNQTVRFREEADDTLQIGQIVMIARTVWVVKNRSEDIWGAGVVGPFDPRGIQNIELECIDVFSDGGVGSQIGFVSDKVITRGIFTDDQGKGEYPYATENSHGLTVGPGFFPLCRVSFGIVRNTRPCETTEIGLKSQVYNQANGLCNFAPLPTPSAMRSSDRRGDSLQSGTMNTYFNRASVFTVWLRPAGLNDQGDEFAWRPLGEQFAIRGGRPVDQYNYLRFIHPQTREYEYKFVPKNGADLAQFSPDDAEFWLLDARLADWKKQGVLLHRSYTTEYGTFGVQAAGRLISKGELEFAPEMSTGLKTNTDNKPLINAPSDIIISEYLPDIDDSSTKATAVAQVGDGWSSLPEGSQGRQAAFFAQIFGKASSYGLTATYTHRHNNLRGGRWLELQYKGTVTSTFPPNHPYFPGWRAWTMDAGYPKVIASSPDMNRGDVFNCRVPMSPGNPRNPYGYSSVGVEVQVSRVDTALGPGGRENGYSFEVLGNAEQFPIGERRRSIFDLTTSGGKSTAVEYSATVVQAPEAIQQAFGVSKVYDQESVHAIPDTSYGDWSRGESITDMRSVSTGNPFRLGDSEVGVVYQVAGIRQEREVVGMSSDRVFEENAAITDLSYYTERSTSNESTPEHEIVYVSETITSEPEYDKLTTCGLAMRSGREFKQVDQLRCWLYSGMEVKRFHPKEAGTIGPSNMLPDLVYHLMTDHVAGIGELVSEELIDLPSFASACTFLKTNKLYFNGALTEPENLRDYITEIAPFFIMDFAIIGGKFSFTPAVPTTSAGTISTGAVPISALFTEGNIIEGTFEVEYLEADQRRDFIAVMRWRDEQVNKLPEEKTVSIRWNRAGSENAPIESFDMTEYCCSEDHAVIAAKYLLSIRDRVTHSVTFKTTPEGLNLAPGQYIKVMTQASPYQAANNGVIEADGTLVMSSNIDDNVYPIYYFDADTDYVAEGSMTVIGGKVQEEKLWGTIVTLRYPGISAQIYQVQQLTLDEEGLVEVVALEHPTDQAGVSLIAQDLIKESGNFRRGF